MRRSRVIAVLVGLSMLILLTGAPTAASDPGRTYEVTIENLTGGPGSPGIPSAGQPFTPALVSTHKGNDGLFTVGKTASFGLKEIAENGNLDPMLTRLGDDLDFADVVVGFGSVAAPILPGETVTFEIEAGPPFNFLSWASMLICTNDGFTGVDTLKLPDRVGESVSAHTQGYDAGTEDNTELFADIVPPCGSLTGQDNMDQGTGSSDPTLAEGGVIHHHAGILGVGDLDPEINDWDNPVARITVERTG